LNGKEVKMFESFVEEFVKKLREVIPGLVYTYETPTTTHTLKHSSRSFKDEGELKWTNTEYGTNMKRDGS